MRGPQFQWQDLVSGTLHNLHKTRMRERHEHKHSHKDLSTMKNGCCANGIGLGMVNFLHFTWYETAFWISAEHRVAHKGIILSLLNSVYTESRPLLFLVPHPHEEAERTQLGWLTPTMALCLAYNAGGRRRKEAGDIQSDGISLLKPQLCMMEPCCPGDGCLPMGSDE